MKFLIVYFLFQTAHAQVLYSFTEDERGIYPKEFAENFSLAEDYSLLKDEGAVIQGLEYEKGKSARQIQNRTSQWAVLTDTCQGQPCHFTYKRKDKKESGSLLKATTYDSEFNFFRIAGGGNKASLIECKGKTTDKTFSIESQFSDCQVFDQAICDAAISADKKMTESKLLSRVHACKKDIEALEKEFSATEKMGEEHLKENIPDMTRLLKQSLYRPGAMSSSGSHDATAAVKNPPDFFSRVRNFIRTVEFCNQHYAKFAADPGVAPAPRAKRNGTK